MTPWPGQAIHREQRSEPLLQSRASAFERCRTALRGRQGPIAITGEAGSGKSWLWKRLEAEAPPLTDWIALDLAPSDTGADLHRRILKRLDATVASPSWEDPRESLEDTLAERRRRGRSTVLVIDEAQNASEDVIEAVRLLSNRLGAPEGLDGLILAGLSELAGSGRSGFARRLATRWASWVDLGVIDLEDASTLLSWTRPHRAWPIEEVEDLYERAVGNPTLLVRLADYRETSGLEEPAAEERSQAPRWTSALDRPASESAASSSLDDPYADADAEADEELEPRATMSARPRPPLRWEEGLIEVGWDLKGEGESHAEAAAPNDRLDLEAESDARVAHTAPVEPNRPAPIPPSEPARCEARSEAVDDPYARISLEEQWRRAERAARSVQVQGDFPSQTVADNSETPRRPDATRERFEPAQSFAPYGKLFAEPSGSSADRPGAEWPENGD